jgi:hypothetical protein
MTKYPISKHKVAVEYAKNQVSEIWILNWVFVWNLVLVYWGFALK